MSVKAINWALSQRLRDNNMKIVLFVLADYANKDDQTCWPANKNIADLAELSVSTVKEKLRDLELLKLISRAPRIRKDGGRSSNEIQLHLDVQVDLGAVEETAVDPDDVDNTPSQNLTGDSPQPIVSAQPPADSSRPTPSRLAGQQEEPSTDPSIKTLPPTPEEEPDGFAEFWDKYPDHELMDRDRTLAAFKALTASERAHAVAVIDRYAKLIREKERKPKNANTWLDQKRFANFPKDGWRSQSDKTFLEATSKAFRALVVLANIEQRTPPQSYQDDQTGLLGIWRHGVVPPDLEALGEFDVETYADWRVVERGSTEFNAWASRIKDWTGRYTEPLKINLGGIKRHQKPDKTWFEVPNRTFGLRVPCAWPPRKDGSIGPPSESQSAA
jgi:hypothetical protein